MIVMGILICFVSCREQNPHDPSVDHDMEGVAKSVREGREKAEKWADGQKDTDSITVESQASDRLPLRDSL